MGKLYQTATEYRNDFIALKKEYIAVTDCFYGQYIHPLTFEYLYNKKEDYHIDFAIFHFRLTAVKAVGESFVQEAMILCKDVPLLNNNIDLSFRNRFPQDDIIHFIGRQKDHFIYLDEIISLHMENSDDNMTKQLLSQTTPYFILDDFLGELEFVRHNRSFHCNINKFGKCISLSIDLDSKNSTYATQIFSHSLPKHLLELARKIVKHLEEWDQQAKEKMGDHILDTENNWRISTDQLPLSKQDFIQKISLSSISISADLSILFCYDNGELFLDQVIAVMGNEKDGFISSEIWE